MKLLFGKVIDLEFATMNLMFVKSSGGEKKNERNYLRMDQVKFVEDNL